MIVETLVGAYVSEGKVTSDRYSGFASDVYDRMQQGQGFVSAVNTTIQERHGEVDLQFRARLYYHMVRGGLLELASRRLGMTEGGGNPEDQVALWGEDKTKKYP